MSEGTIFIEWAPPHWPPRHSLQLQSQHVGKDVVHISCEPPGYFLVTESSSAGAKRYPFQLVMCEPNGFVKIAVAWSDNDVRMFASGKKLTPLDLQQEPFALDVIARVSHPWPLVELDSDLVDKATDEERLFLFTLADLSSRLNNGTDYDLLRASALIRQMFFDAGTPLAFAINRHYRIALQFSVLADLLALDDEMTPDIEIAALVAYPPEEAEMLSLDQFLARIAIRHGEVKCTVKDIVATVAHVFGGVHLGSAREVEERVLKDLRDVMLVARQSMVLRVVHDIGQVSIAALMPLVRAIEQRIARLSSPAP
jgi:hypothetical protein